MSLSSVLSRKNLWNMINAADATISTAQYAALTDRMTAADTDADTVIVDAATAQSAIDALELKNDIIASKDANNTAAVKAQGAMPNTVKTLKVVNEAGATIGYTPVYATATLT